MLSQNAFIKLSVFIIVLLVLGSSGCGVFSPKTREKTVTLLQTETADQASLLEIVTRKNMVEINKRDDNRQNCTNYQDAENHQIQRYRDNVMFIV